MVHLIVGPSSCGKSTYIEQMKLSPVVFAHEVKSNPVPDGGVLHYNMLFGAPKDASADQRLWDLRQEPVFRKILDSKKVGAVTVIVAPIDELLERAGDRDVVEKGRDGGKSYPSDKWQQTIRNTDLFAMYERVFDTLEAAGLDYDVVYSSRTQDGFVPSDRTFVHHNLRGTLPRMPSEADVEAVLSLNGVEYQEVRLPLGKRTVRKGFKHLQGGRDDAYAQIASVDFRDREILDIGSALGDMIFRSERLGARRLVGIEMMPKRFEASTAIRSVLSSNAELLHCDFLDAALDEPFDDVLILNVIHHVADIRGFLNKAAKLTKKRLIIEFPTLSDKKFRHLGQVPRWIPSAVLARLPIIGVSHSDEDQTFVFTLPALERILSESGTFRVEHLKSSIPHREMVAFHRVSDIA